MKFKTNAGCARCKAKILESMQSHFPNMEWSLDLDNADKMLECHGIPDDSEKAAEIIKTLEQTGFKGSWVPADE